MSGLPKPHEVVAILIADVHLSHKPPAYRSGEPNWYDAMERQLFQLHQLQLRYIDAVIVCAGDVFDRWDSPPELINFAMRTLPKMYAVPGQHDLAYHRFNDIKRTAYWTLCEYGAIQTLNAGEPRERNNGLRLHGFPWGFPPTPNPDTIRKGVPLDLAVVHSYVWTEGNSFPGAPEDKRLRAYAKGLKGYDVAVFGDNHKPFLSASHNRCTVVNCGGFFRRRSDDNHEPSAWLLKSDGSVVRYVLDTSKDVYAPEADRWEPENVTRVREFAKELAELDADSVDFPLVVKALLLKEKPPRRVRELVLKLMEDVR